MTQRGVKAIGDAPRDKAAGEALQEMLDMNERELPKIDLPGEADIEPVFDGKAEAATGKKGKATRTLGGSTVTVCVGVEPVLAVQPGRRGRRVLKSVAALLPPRTRRPA